MALTKNINLDVLCPLTLTVFYLTVYLLSSVSFMNVTAIAVDRLLAVSLHLRYQELVTSKRVMIALVAIWLSSCLPVTSLDGYISVVFGSMGYVLTTAAYFRVYKVARYHQNRIQNQFQPQSSQAVALLRERKSSSNVVYIYIIYIACYLPGFFCLVLQTTSYSSGSMYAAHEVTFFFVLLNSSLNPLVYCWRYPEVRQIMTSTSKKIFRVPWG